MSKGVRIFLIICAVMVGGGLLMTGAGVLMGGRLNGVYLDGNGWFHFGGYESGSRIMAQIERLDDEFDDDWEDDMRMAETALDSFTSVDLELSACSVEFVPGSSYGVRYKYHPELEKPEFTVENGVLRVTGKKAEDTDWFLLGKQNSGSKLKIIYPQGTQFDKLNIDCALGDVDLDDVDAKEIRVVADCGNVEGENVISQALTVEVAMGNLELDGAFYGMNQIDCAMGNVEITTRLSRSEYNYDISTALSAIELNGRAVSRSLNENNNAPNSWKISCDAGSVEIDCR